MNSIKQGSIFASGVMCDTARFAFAGYHPHLDKRKRSVLSNSASRDPLGSGFI